MDRLYSLEQSSFGTSNEHRGEPAPKLGERPRNRDREDACEKIEEKRSTNEEMEGKGGYFWRVIWISRVHTMTCESTQLFDQISIRSITKPRNRLSREYYKFTNIIRTFPSPQFVLSFLYRDSSSDDVTLRLETSDRPVEKQKMSRPLIEREYYES